MKKGSIFEGFVKKLRENKKLELIVYGVIIMLALLIFLLTGGLSCDSSEPVQNSAKQNDLTDNAVTEQQLEERLEAILSQITGAGKVRVMITYDNTTEIVPAEDLKSTDGATGSSKDVAPATVSQDGAETPIIITQIMPRIRGVIVVAKGAASIKVKVDLQTAVQTVLGISADRISVFSMDNSLP